MKKIPYAGKNFAEPAEWSDLRGEGVAGLEGRAFEASRAFDREISALWSSGVDTAGIAMKLTVRESAVANRLARLRDARAA